MEVLHGRYVSFVYQAGGVKKKMNFLIGGVKPYVDEMRFLSGTTYH